MRNFPRQRLIAPAVTLLFACLAPIFLLGARVSAPAQSDVDVTQGLQFLQAQEQNSADRVDEILREQGRQAAGILPVADQRGDDAEIAAMFEEQLAQLEDEQTDIWSYFQNSVILGDSRAVGYYYYGFLDQSRVLADSGNTIRDVEGHMAEIVALQPQYVFLCYGINDIGIGFWNEPEEYAAEMAQIIQSLHENVPDATVVISSILLAFDPAFEKNSSWHEIPQYSAAVGAICDENDAIYVDNDAICEENADLWQDDGIHVRPEFYDIWAKNLMIGIVKHEQEAAFS